MQYSNTALETTALVMHDSNFSYVVPNFKNQISKTYITYYKHHKHYYQYVINSFTKAFFDKFTN